MMSHNKINDKKNNKSVGGSNIDRKYFYYYVGTNELRKVSPTAFAKGEYPVLASESVRIKVVGLANTPKKQLKYLLWEADKFRNEGLVTDVFDAFALLKDVITILGSTKRNLEKIGKLCDVHLILKAISIVMKFQHSAQYGFSVSELVVGLIDLYLLVSGVVNKFKPEMLEEVCIASLSMFLPSKLFEIVKRINVFSSAKLLDDITGIHKLFSVFVDGIVYILDLFPNSTIIKQLKKSLESLCQFGIHAHLYTINKYIREEKIGEKITKSAYRMKIKDLYNQLEHGEFLQWCRKSAAVQNSYQEFLKLYKRVRAFEECARQEPIGIVFQGPPGCGKSRCMNGVIQCLPWSKYVHQVKDVNDGKDFYDMYENETIFYMDDVGQQGISQWRTFINMISEVKYPLDCARAENKDTKFFNSDIVMATTNEFMNLSGLVRTDCIKELPALWRRCIVLDFSKVKFTGSYDGVLSWKYYNLDKQEFLTGLPPHIVSQMSGIQDFTFQCKNNDLDMYAWICKTIVELKKVNEQRLISNQLTESQLQYVRSNVFEGESLFDWSFSRNSDDGELGSNQITASWLDERLNSLKRELNDEELDSSYFSDAKTCFSTVVVDSLKWLFEGLRDILKNVVESIDLSELIAILVTSVLVIGVSFVTQKLVNKHSGTLSENKFSIENLLSEKFSKTNMSTFHESIMRNIKEVVVINDKNQKINVLALLSGHCVLLPGHAITSTGSNYITVYADKIKNHVIYDKLKVAIGRFT